MGVLSVMMSSGGRVVRVSGLRGWMRGEVGGSGGGGGVGVRASGRCAAYCPVGWWFCRGWVAGFGLWWGQACGAGFVVFVTDVVLVLNR